MQLEWVTPNFVKLTHFGGTELGSETEILFIGFSGKNDIKLNEVSIFSILFSTIWQCYLVTWE